MVRKCVCFFQSNVHQTAQGSKVTYRQTHEEGVPGEETCREKGGNVCGCVTSVEESDEFNRQQRLTGSGAREDRDGQGEGDARDVSQQGSGGSGVAVHPGLGLGLLVVDHRSDASLSPDPAELQQPGNDAALFPEGINRQLRGKEANSAHFLTSSFPPQHGFGFKMQ